METQTKLKSTWLTIGVAIVNTVGAYFALPALTVPADADVASAIMAIVIWLVGVLAIYMPTIITAIANAGFIKSKTEQNIAGIQAGTVEPGYEVTTPVAKPTEPTGESTETEVEQPAFVPFNKEAFIADVESKVMGIYGVRNACTLFYTAQSVIRTWKHTDWESANDLMKSLADSAFKEVWGETYDEALVNVGKPDATGCTYPNLKYKAMQLGMAYYAIYLEVVKYQ